MKKQLNLVLTILIIIGLTQGLAYIFGDKLILFPSKNKLQNQDLERLNFKSKDNKEIEIYGKVLSKAKYLIIHFMGNKSRAEQDINWFYNAFWKDQSFPVEIWAINYPAYGESECHCTLQEMANSSLEAFDYLIKQRGLNKQIILEGNSIGTTAALYVANERAKSIKIKNLILKNPPALKQMVLEENGWWNLYLIALPVSWKIPKALDSIKNISQISQIPILFLQAEKDETVPVKYQNMIIQAHKGRHKVIVFKEANHSFLPVFAESSRLREGFNWLKL